MIKTVQIAFLCLVYWLTPILIQAQEKPDADALFMEARDAAFNDRWAEARKICRRLLSYYPDYNDATILLGRTYAWETKTDSARMIIAPLLDVEPDSHDVLSLLADNEIWGGNYDYGLEYVNQALVYYPSDEDFLFRKGNAYYLKNDNDNAAKAFEDLLAVSPNHEKGRALLNLLQSPDGQKNRRLDDLYTEAEEQTKAGNWKKARNYCRQVLREDPEHFPASLLMAQNFAFESKFDSARVVTSELSKTHPDNYDLLDLMVSIEIWDNKLDNAMKQVNTALDAYPDDQNFLYKKAFIQYLFKDYNDALKTLDHLLSINPEHEDGIKLRDEILKRHKNKDYVFTEEYFELYKYEDGNNVQKLVNSTGLAKWTKYGTYIGKINTGDILPYDTLAGQFELEAYQILFHKNYLWLDYAYSPNDNFFPLHRGGAEYFQGMFKGLEWSAGMRFLYWSRKDVGLTVFGTASVSWMKNKDYLTLRGFFADPNVSASLIYRRYFSERSEYLYALVGYGGYSDEYKMLLDSEQTKNNSWLAQIGILKFITVHWFLLASAGYTKYGKDRDNWTASIGARYYFNMFKEK